MFDATRRWLHAWSTQRKNQKSIAALESHLRTRDPALLVHQMGRAGSMTTVNSLRAAGLMMPVFHTHWLNPTSVAQRVGWVRHLPEHRHPLNVRTSVRIAREIAQDGPQHRSWHIVSVFREPVARNLSVFFLSIETFIPGFFQRHARGAITHDEILGVFIDRFPHEQPINWFDEELRDVFGIDVYHTPFPGDSGYQIIEEAGASLLLIKVEDLDRCYRDAFKSFLGIDIPALKQTHVTAQDPSYSMYRDFMAHVKLPVDYVERLYDSQFARHFYSEQERASLRARWCGAAA